MKSLFRNILIASIVLGLNATPVLAAAMPEPVPAAQTNKQKEAEKAKAQKEKEKAKAAKEKEKEKAAKAKEKEKAAKAKEKEKAAKAKEKEQAAKEKEREQAAKEKEQAAKAKEQAAKAKEKEQAAKERQEAIEKKEAARRAQEEKAVQAYKKQQEALEHPKTPVISYFNLGLRAGYSAMMDQINGQYMGAGTINQSNALQQLKGGGGAGLDVTYNLEYKHFLFETGLDFRFLNSTSAYGFQATRTEQTYGATYTYLFDNLRETRNMLEFGIPVMLGAQFDKFYFLVGAKVHYGLPLGYKHKGQYDIVVNDPALLEPYGMGIYDLNGKTEQKIRFKQPDVSVAAEIGLDLDEWLQKDADPKKKVKVKPGERQPFGRQHVHYRVGLFAEYGVLNTNATQQANPVAFNTNNVEVDHTNTLLAMNGDTKLNNLFVGVKFTIQFEVPGKEEKQLAPPPSTVYYTIVDEETKTPLDKALIAVKDNNSGKVVMREKQVGIKGTSQRLPMGSYAVEVTADGYYTGKETYLIKEVGSREYITITMLRLPEPPAPEPVVMPVEKGEVFIMKNLHFATNRTRILPTSEEALNSLFMHLVDHPDIRIKIIGHTDNIGRDAANQKLSEGRATAVRNALISRGIDPSRMEVEGRGETQPIDTNDTEEGRQNNRRVEIEIL